MSRSVEELETRISFLERAHEELSMALYQLDKRLAELELTNRALRDKVSDLSDSIQPLKGHEPPPHY